MSTDPGSVADPPPSTGAPSTTAGHITASIAPRPRMVRGALALAAGGAVALSALALKAHPDLTAPPVIVAGTRTAGVLLECDRGGGRVTVAVQPQPATLRVTVAGRDPSGKRPAVALTGLEPGTSYRVQPSIDGVAVGPPLPLTTHGSAEQLASAVTVSFTDTRSVRVSFFTPLAVPAGLSLAGEVPGAWAAAESSPRTLSAGGLDPDGTTKPALVFEGLPEPVLLPEIPGARRLVERARQRLTSAVGGPSHKDRRAVFARMSARASERAVPRERVREDIDRFVQEATGARTELVLSAAAAVAGDATLPAQARWRAAEVLDGLALLEAMGRPWCGASVLDVERRRPPFPSVARPERVRRPKLEPRFEQWVKPGPARQHVAHLCLPLWSHRDQPEGSDFMRMHPTVAESWAVEEQITENPFWAMLSPPVPPGGPQAGSLVLLVHQIVEDRVLWLRFGGTHTLALFGPRDTRPIADSSVATRRSRCRPVVVALPPGIGGPTLEVRLDSFEAARGAFPVPVESWIVDGWVMP